MITSCMGVRWAASTSHPAPPQGWTRSVHRPTPRGGHNQICHCEASKGRRGGTHCRNRTECFFCCVGQHHVAEWASKGKLSTYIYFFLNDFTHKGSGCIVGVLVCSVCPRSFRATVVSWLAATKDFLQIRWESWVFAVLAGGTRNLPTEDTKELSFVFGRTDCDGLQKTLHFFFLCVNYFRERLNNVILHGSDLCNCCFANVKMLD